MSIVNMKRYNNKGALDKMFGTSWHYIGRPSRKKHLKGSALANPYSHHPKAKAIHVEDRQEAVKRYREWLWSQINANNEAVLEELRKVHGKVLVCWCSPMLCHGSVVEKAAKWLAAYEEEHGRIS